MHKLIPFLFFVAMAATGCRQNQTATVKTTDTVDSIDVLYFQKPFTDSSRYTRYFSIARVADSALKVLILGLDQKHSSILEKPRPCLSEGKIILPKGGDAFKVFYFSRSGPDSCNYIYEIKDGLFYYYPLPAQLTNRLNEFESKATKPG